MTQAAITFHDDREELSFLRAYRRVTCLADELLEDCLERGLGLESALDVFIAQCARLLGASDGFVQLWGARGPVLAREHGPNPIDLEAEEGAHVLPGGTLCVKRLALGSLKLGSFALFVPELPEREVPVALALVDAMGEQLDSALLGFVALADGASPSERIDELAAGGCFRPHARMGRYELLAPLGAGGMAQVFVARQLGPDGIGRLVALKRILPRLTADEATLTQFQDEARIGLRLAHPNLVAVHDFGRTPAGYYLALELVRGVSLSALLARTGPLAPSLAVGVIVQALHGLHAAHELRGEDGGPLALVHRDLSPGNLMVGYDGVTKVLDFGVAKARGQRSETVVGLLKGKQLYMSPEHALGEPVDRRSDLFAAAVVLYEALTGVRAFARENQLATLTAVVNAAVAPDPRIPEALWTVLLRGLAKQRSERFPDALEMARSLSAAVVPADEAALGELVRASFAESWRASLGWEAAARGAPTSGDQPRPLRRQLQEEPG